MNNETRTVFLEPFYECTRVEVERYQRVLIFSRQVESISMS